VTVDLDDLENRIMKWCSGRPMPSGTVTIVQQALVELASARLRIQELDKQLEMRTIGETSMNPCVIHGAQWCTCLNPSPEPTREVVSLVAAPIRLILSMSHNFDWSIQGFGMLRAYLSKERRLHIWHSSGKVDNVSTIHDHPWDFTSYVVAGSITDRVYTMAEIGLPSHHKQRIRCGPGGCALDQRYDVLLELQSERTYGPGESYARKSWELHETLPEDGTVTLVTRQFKEDTEHAWVCFPLGTEWVSAEPRKATGAEEDRFVKAALAALEAVR